MTINIKRDFVYKALICFGALLGVVAIFCFCGTAIEYREQGFVLKLNSSVFNYMFGTNGVNSCPGLVVLFIFELIALIGGVALVILFFMKKLNKKQLTIYILSLAGLFLVCAILSFCTKAFILATTLRQPGVDPQAVKESFKYMNISSGPIWYSILTLIGMVSLGSSVFMFNKKEQPQQK